jgi:hypothetical protein
MKYTHHETFTEPLVECSRDGTNTSGESFLAALSVLKGATQAQLATNTHDTNEAMSMQEKEKSSTESESESQCHTNSRVRHAAEFCMTHLFPPASKAQT